MIQELEVEAFDEKITKTVNERFNERKPRFCETYEIEV